MDHRHSGDSADSTKHSHLHGAHGGDKNGDKVEKQHDTSDSKVLSGSDACTPTQQTKEAEKQAKVEDATKYEKNGVLPPTEICDDRDQSRQAKPTESAPPQADAPADPKAAGKDTNSPEAVGSGGAVDQAGHIAGRALGEAGKAARAEAADKQPGAPAGDAPPPGSEPQSQESGGGRKLGEAAGSLAEKAVGHGSTGGAAAGAGRAVAEAATGAGARADAKAGDHHGVGAAAGGAAAALKGLDRTPQATRHGDTGTPGGAAEKPGDPHGQKVHQRAEAAPPPPATGGDRDHDGKPAIPAPTGDSGRDRSSDHGKDASKDAKAEAVATGLGVALQASGAGLMSGAASSLTKAWYGRH